MMDCQFIAACNMADSPYYGPQGLTFGQWLRRQSGNLTCSKAAVEYICGYLGRGESASAIWRASKKHLHPKVASQVLSAMREYRRLPEAD